MSTGKTNTVSPVIPTTLPEFLARFAGEQDCRNYLMRQQSKAGFNCPACDNNKAWWNDHSGNWKCTRCAEMVPLTTGTPMDGSEQPLTDWFLAAWMVASQGGTTSAEQLQSTLNIKRYEIAWDMLRRLRESLHAPESGMLIGEVEVDEAALCGEQFRLRGIPAVSGDIIILGAAEVRGRGIGRVRLAAASDVSSSSLMDFVSSNVDARTSTVLTDSLLGYRPLNSMGYEHITVVKPGLSSPVRDLPRIHRVFEDLSDWLASRAEKVTEDNISRVLHEYQGRFNARRQPAASFQSLLGLKMSDERVCRRSLRASGE